MQEFSYRLQWEDERLYRNPCYGVIRDLLSMSRAQGKSDVGRDAYTQTRNMFWMPVLEAQDLAPGFDIWDDIVEADAPSRNRSLVKLSAESEMQVVQPQISTKYYVRPFCLQRIVPGSTLMRPPLAPSELSGGLPPFVSVFPF